MQNQSPDFLPSLARLELVNIIRKWGDINTDAVLDPTCQIYHHPSIEGVIGYRLESNTVVVLGDPITSQENKALLAMEFHKFCHEKKYSVIYSLLSPDFAEWTHTHLEASLIQFGNKITTNPQVGPFNRTGEKASLVRRKVRHATKEGTHVEEYLGQNSHLEQSLEEVGKQWLQSRKGPQIHISNAHLFSDRQGKRWFYAKQGEQICGVMVANQLEAQKGWLCNHIMITPDAPHGTPELLIVKTLETLAFEQSSYVTFGAFPSSQLEKTVGFSKMNRFFMHSAFFFARHLFHLDGHMKFWEKFEPAMQPSYIALIGKQHPIRMVKSMLRAFNAI